MFAVFGSLHLYMRHNYLTKKTPNNFEILNRNFEEKNGVSWCEGGEWGCRGRTLTSLQSDANMQEKLIFIGAATAAFFLSITLMIVCYVKRWCCFMVNM